MLTIVALMCVDIFISPVECPVMDQRMSVSLAFPLQIIVFLIPQDITVLDQQISLTSAWMQYYRCSSDGADEVSLIVYQNPYVCINLVAPSFCLSNSFC